MEKVWSIQYLRAIAALGVVIFHTLESSQHRFIVGQAGVDLFFIISGFIMASLMSGPEDKPGIFLGRRIARIVPLYWIATFAALFVTWIKPNFFQRMDVSAHNTILSLFFIPHDSATGVAPVLWQGWTLEYEMFFYGLCALALLLSPTAYRLWVLCAALAALVVLGGVAPLSGNFARVYTNPLLLEFVAGIALAAAWRRKLALPWTIGAVSIAAGIVILALEHFRVAETGIRIVDWGIPALLIAMGALSFERSGRVARLPKAALMGDASYALYLTHGFAIGPFLWYFSHAPLWLRVPVCLTSAIVLALGVYLLAERPFQRFARTLIAGRGQAAALTPIG